MLEGKQARLHEGMHVFIQAERRDGIHACHPAFITACQLDDMIASCQVSRHGGMLAG
jgi:hypothetical protein